MKDLTCYTLFQFGNYLKLVLLYLPQRCKINLSHQIINLLTIVAVIYTMDFVEDSDHAEKRFCGTPFPEQILTDHLLVEYLSMVASIKLQIN